jgi:hypothetical protein
MFIYAVERAKVQPVKVKGKIHGKILGWDPVWVGSSKHDTPQLMNHHQAYLGGCLRKVVLEEVPLEQRYLKEQYWMDYFTAFGASLENKQRAYGRS